MTTADPTLALEPAPTVAALGSSPRAVFERLAGCGIRAVQLSATQPGLRPRDLARSARRDLVATLRRHELVLAGLDAWIPPGDLVERATCDRAVGAIIAAIELASDLGRVPVSLTLPDAGDDRAAGAVAAIEARAAHLGVRLADHAVPPGRGRAEGAIGAGIDPAAWLARGDDPARGAAALGGAIASARLVDLLRSGVRGPIGDASEGRLDHVAYRVSLSVAGVGRPIVVDARQWSSPWEGVRATVDAWATAGA